MRDEFHFAPYWLAVLICLVLHRTMRVTFCGDGDDDYYLNQAVLEAVILHLSPFTEYCSYFQHRVIFTKGL